MQKLASPSGTTAAAVGLGGSEKMEGGGMDMENDVTTFGFGVQAGLVAWF